MEELKSLFYKKVENFKPEIRTWAKDHGQTQVDTVSLSQVVGGMRGIKSMFWDISNLDPEEGIRFRGYTIPQLRELLPKVNSTEPLPEGLFWLMLTNEIPTEQQVKDLADDWEKRNKLPEYLTTLLDALPNDTHPMTQFSMAINSLHQDSVFAKRYEEGMSKSDHWDATFEDAMNLIAKLPAIAAYIYNRTYKGGEQRKADTSLDWAANFAHLLGREDEEFRDFLRLYMVIHADHEGGNASAHTTHLVNSTWSSIFNSFSAGMNALAGPLHGLANQEVIKWIFEMLEDLGTDDPTDDQIADYINRTLDEGKVIPGYGHAVLRKPDPRFMAQKDFAEEHLQDSKIVNIVWRLYNIVPPILMSLGKVKNPWPNVDAHSGAILVHYGLKEYTFYTVLFGVSRALGVLCGLCWDRALGMPLERPKSVESSYIRNLLSNS